MSHLINLCNIFDLSQQFIGQNDEGGVTPSKILSFITGAEKPPPMGFAQQPTIRFIEDKTKILPTASMCALSLYLPLPLTEYQSFQHNMDMAILNTIGFGQVKLYWYHTLSTLHLFLSFQLCLPFPSHQLASRVQSKLENMLLLLVPENSLKFHFHTSTFAWSSFCVRQW